MKVFVLLFLIWLPMVSFADGDTAPNIPRRVGFHAGQNPRVMFGIVWESNEILKDVYNKQEYIDLACAMAGKDPDGREYCDINYVLSKDVAFAAPSVPARFFALQDLVQSEKKKLRTVSKENRMLRSRLAKMRSVLQGYAAEIKQLRDALRQTDTRRKEVSERAAMLVDQLAAFRKRAAETKDRLQAALAQERKRNAALAQERAQQADRLERYRLAVALLVGLWCAWFFTRLLMKWRLRGEGPTLRIEPNISIPPQRGGDTEGSKVRDGERTQVRFTIHEREGVVDVELPTAVPHGVHRGARPLAELYGTELLQFPLTAFEGVPESGVYIPGLDEPVKLTPRSIKKALLKPRVIRAVTGGNPLTGAALA